MSLRKGPTVTPALLSANRANAQKRTGPRTPEAKTRLGPKRPAPRTQRGVFSRTSSNPAALGESKWPRIGRLPLKATDRAALQFEAIISLKISHLRSPEVLKAIMLLKISEM